MAAKKESAMSPSSQFEEMRRLSMSLPPPSFNPEELLKAKADAGDDGDDDDTGIIIGSVIGGFVGLLLIVGLVYYFFFRTNGDIEEPFKRADSQSSSNSMHRSTAGGANKVRGTAVGGDDEVFSNPIYSSQKDKAGGKTADSYGGL